MKKIRKIILLLVVVLLSSATYEKRTMADDYFSYDKFYPYISDFDFTQKEIVGKTNMSIDIPSNSDNSSFKKWKLYYFKTDATKKMTIRITSDYADKVNVYMKDGTSDNMLHKVANSVENEHNNAKKESYLTYEFEKDKIYYIGIGSTKTNPDHKVNLSIEDVKKLKSIKSVSLSSFFSNYGFAGVEFEYTDSTKKTVYNRYSGNEPEVISAKDEYGNYFKFAYSDSGLDAWKAKSGKYDVIISGYDYDGKKTNEIKTNVNLISYDDVVAKATVLPFAIDASASKQGNIYKINEELFKKNYYAIAPSDYEDNNISGNEILILLIEPKNSSKYKYSVDSSINIRYMSDIKYSYLGNEETYILAFARNKKVNFCIGNIGAVVPVNSVTLPANVSLNIGDMEFLADSIVIAPANATNKSVIWKSSNPAVATVSANGKVTAISAGATKITAYVDGKATSTVVTVNRLAQTIAKFKIDNGKKYVDKVTVKVRDLKKAKKTFALYTVSTDEKSKKTYKVLSATKKKRNGKFAKFSKKKFKISKGKLVIPKDLGKGTYKIKVKVTARITSKYNAVMKEKTFTMIVK